MSCRFNGPIKSQTPLPALNGSVNKTEIPLNGIIINNHDNDNNNTKSRNKPPAGRRRVFVQTETGCVLCMDLDRGDNAHTVKRRLQIALNFPTDSSSLTFGDKVLNNDLSSIRAESSLLLTRNTMHRSCSTPCLNPNPNNNQSAPGAGRSHLIEILGSSSSQSDRLKQLVMDAIRAIKTGVDPIPVNSGLGGSYYFRNTDGDNVAIVKPTDEEPFAPNNPKGFVGKTLGQPGLKRSVRVGETGFREVAAYLLDHENFANVPPTALVKITHSVFHLNRGVKCKNGSNVPVNPVTCKIASFQQFVPHNFDASDHGTSSFPVSAVHRIGILDIRIFNTDRHGGNVLVRKTKSEVGKFGAICTELVPIDHGLCLPETLEDPYFEWIHWPQSSIPFSEEELEYISKLDPKQDSDLLKKELPMIRESCIRVLVLCTTFLKIAADLGLCLAEIGEMMSRVFKGLEEEPSQLELVCMEARRAILERETCLPINEKDEGVDCNNINNDFQFHMDIEEINNGLGLVGLGFKNPLPKLDENIEEEQEEEREEKEEESHVKRVAFVKNLKNGFASNVSNLSKSLKGVCLIEKKPLVVKNYDKGRNPNLSPSPSPSPRPNPNPSGANRSAEENFPPSVCFVKLGDMGKEEWELFLEKFKELLVGALNERKVGPAGQWQKQRLGTSCKF